MRAVALQIEVGDLDGLRRTLHHAAVLEESADDPAFGRDLQGFLAALAVS